MPIRLLVTAIVVSLGVCAVNAQIRHTSFESGGVALPAIMHQAEGEGYLPTVVYLHGNPGSRLDDSSELADHLTADGVNVFRFNYRGLWGNGGDFTLTNAVGDAASALDFLSTSENIERFQIDTSRVTLLGYSFGSTTALVTSFSDNRIRDVIGLGVCDHSHFGREFLNPHSEIRQFLEQTIEALFGENGVIDQKPAIFVDDLVENIYGFGLPEHAETLSNNRLLFVVGVNDMVCPVEDHVFPLFRALEESGHPDMTVKFLFEGHGFSNLPRADLYQHYSDWIHSEE